MHCFDKGCTKKLNESPTFQWDPPKSPRKSQGLLTCIRNPGEITDSGIELDYSPSDYHVTDKLTADKLRPLAGRETYTETDSPNDSQVSN